MSEDLEILIARLRWPVSATRWWVIQELAAFLLLPATCEEVSRRLLKELTRCRLEGEAVEILFIFWMAAKRGGRPNAGLIPALTRPSLLAEVLLRDMGLTLHEQPNPSLQQSPDDFDAPAQFVDIQGVNVPRVYRTRLLQLERDTGLPFIRQCAFEWFKTEQTYPGAPLQGDLGHFVRPLGGNATGGLTSRATHRMTTAYQRTLAVARAFWGAPEKWTMILALAALPIDPTLAFLRSTRPRWLPPLGQGVGTRNRAVKAFIRDAIAGLSATHPGSVLLALVTPTYVSDNEIVEVSVVRWRQWGSTTVDAQDLAKRFHAQQIRGYYGACQASGCAQTTSVPKVELERVLDPETNAAPMATVYGFGRIGYLQTDLYPNRLYYPIMTGIDGGLTVEPMEGNLKISSGHRQVATLNYWNAGWSPAHPTAMSGLCGTALIGEAAPPQANGEQTPDRHFYLWRVMRLRRTASYESFVAEEPVCGAIFSGSPTQCERS
ncbi:multidrug DMT transporter permease [Variovorax sp. VaC1]|uniref:multidrug DMT transporter permease n=1 Tax=Variovorax sp. VaC1 TaxID=3373132 RepID=UPI0037480971